jgi:hypothetical protein
MTDVETDIDSGAGAATLEIGTTGFGSTLLTFTLSDPAGTVSGDVLTLSGMPKTANAAAGGTAAEGRIKESGGTVIVSGLTVGTSGTNIIISNTTITNGAAYSLTAGTITHNTSGT